MEKIIISLKGWVEDRENELGRINEQIKHFQEAIIKNDLKRFDVENDIADIKKAIEILEAANEKNS